MITRIIVDCEAVVEAIKDYLDGCDVDELASIASFVSGADVWEDMEDPAMLEIDMDRHEYNGMFDYLIDA